MNPEIKAAWLAALRSSDYTQTTGGLHDDVGYCCLGVLCDLHAKATDGVWEPSQGWRIYKNETGTLPPIIQTWAGVDDESPEVFGEPISVYNDGFPSRSAPIKKHTFAEIADLIEAHL